MIGQNVPQRGYGVVAAIASDLVRSQSAFRQLLPAFGARRARQPRISRVALVIRVRVRRNPIQTRRLDPARTEFDGRTGPEPSNAGGREWQLRKSAQLVIDHCPCVNQRHRGAVR